MIPQGGNEQFNTAYLFNEWANNMYNTNPKQSPVNVKQNSFMEKIKNLKGIAKDGGYLPTLN